MAKRQLDAVALLKADHRKVEDLFEKFQKAQGASKKQALVQQICEELCVHTIIEEEIFYPACTNKIEEDVVDEAYVEHDGAKVLIAELLASEPDEEFYDAKVSVLSEQIKHHVREEEKRSEGMFAQAKEAGLDFEEIGARIKERKDELLAEIKANGLPPLETRSYRGHKLQQGHPVEPASA
jgi:hypothetical protein